jgi:hypothetical protein
MRCRTGKKSAGRDVRIDEMVADTKEIAAENYVLVTVFHLPSSSTDNNFLFSLTANCKLPSRMQHLPNISRFFYPNTPTIPTAKTLEMSFIMKYQCQFTSQ